MQLAFNNCGAGAHHKLSGQVQTKRMGNKKFKLKRETKSVVLEWLKGGRDASSAGARLATGLRQRSQFGLTDVRHGQRRHGVVGAAVDDQRVHVVDPLQREVERPARCAQSCLRFTNRISSNFFSR